MFFCTYVTFRENTNWINNWSWNQIECTLTVAEQQYSYNWLKITILLLAFIIYLHPNESSFCVRRNDKVAWLVCNRKWPLSSPFKRSKWKQDYYGLWHFQTLFEAAQEVLHSYRLLAAQWSDLCGLSLDPAVTLHWLGNIYWLFTWLKKWGNGFNWQNQVFYYKLDLFELVGDISF